MDKWGSFLMSEFRGDSWKAENEDASWFLVGVLVWVFLCVCLSAAQVNGLFQAELGV